MNAQRVCVSLSSCSRALSVLLVYWCFHEGQQDEQTMEKVAEPCSAIVKITVHPTKTNTMCEKLCLRCDALAAVLQGGGVEVSHGHHVKQFSSVCVQGC